MVVHGIKTVMIKMGCDCGWEGEARTSKREANDDFTQHLVDQIKGTRSPSWAAKHPENTDGGKTDE
jgi:hypothetical protein